MTKKITTVKAKYDNNFFLEPKFVIGKRQRYCVKGVLKFWHVEKKDAYLCISNHKPKHHQYYQIERLTYDYVWEITDMEGWNVSPWTCDLDELFNRRFPGKKKLYMWVEQ